MSTARFILVADDYGLSPGVSEGIRQLIAAGRLTGTGCMSLFPEWPEEARLLKALPSAGQADIGLHLTLTDFPALTGWSPDGTGRMPALKSLITATASSHRHDGAIRAELDAQLAAFTRAWGAAPAYLDGHQHVHFLRPVRQWLSEKAALFRKSGPLPWLRGAPAMHHASGAALRAKVAFVSLLARGFNARMRAAGYPVEGPLAGFYDWTSPESFPPALKHWQRTLPGNVVVMVHPGLADDVLRSRDSLIEAREVELKTLLAAVPLALRREMP